MVRWLGVALALASIAMVTGCATAGSAASASSSSSSSSSPPVDSSLRSSASALDSVSQGEVTPKGELQGPFPVTRVVDGDTIHVDTSQGDLKVRLIGIDTPETVDPNRPDGCFGAEASAQAQRLLAGTSVYLELDPSQGDTDRFGRTLAFVWMSRQEMFNLIMVQQGFATEYTYDKPYAYQAEFQAAQAQARAAQAGLWSPSTCNGVVRNP